MTVVCCSLSWLCCTVTFACTCCIPFLVRDPLFCCSLAAIIIPLSLPSTPSLLPFLSPLLPPFLLPSHLHLPRFFTHIHHPAAPHLSRPQKLLQALLITLLRGHRRCLPHVSPLVTQPRARLQPPGKKVINYNTKIYYSGDLFSDWRTWVIYCLTYLAYLPGWLPPFRPVTYVVPGEQLPEQRADRKCRPCTSNKKVVNNEIYNANTRQCARFCAAEYVLTSKC